MAKINSVVNSILVQRFQLDTNSDMSVNQGNPLKKDVHFLGYHQMEVGYQTHIDTTFMNTIYEDFQFWFHSSKKMTYNFFHMNKFIKSRLLDQSKTPLGQPKTHLMYDEWMTIDTRQERQTHKIYNIWDVFAQCGGTVHSLKLMSLIVFKSYAS